MKHISVFILTFLIAAVSFRCADTTANSEGLVISGNVNGANSMQVFLDKVGVNPESANLIIAKTDAEPNGDYSLELPQKPQPGVYRLRVGTQKAMLILTGNEDEITVNGDLANFNRFDYEINGSEGSREYLQMMQKLASRQASADDVKQFVSNSEEPMAAMMVAVQSLPPSTKYMDIHETAKKRVESEYPGSSYAQEYESYLAAVRKAAMNPGGRGYAFIEEENRQPAPDIKLPSPNGKEYALSDLKGKVVLLDFWASWCRPCRAENPNVVRVYNEYKDKGFTVYSVSLDGVDSRQAAALKNDQQKIAELRNAQKKRWEDAIEKDGLTWDYHVSDLKKWECAPARTYGVSSIPKTFVIDKEGRIAAVNVRGEDLEKTLERLL